MTMASLPKECRAVLAAPEPESEMAVTIGGDGTAVAAVAPPDAPVPAMIDPSAALPVTANAFAATPDIGIPLPRPRPQN